MRAACLLLLLPLCLAPRFAIAAAPPPDTLAPAVKSALRDLSAEEFATREKALHDLQIAIGQQAQGLLRPDDPETQARVAALLEFNEGLSRWILNVMDLPASRRRAELAVGLRADMLPVVAKLGSASAATRLEGVQALARLKDPMIAELLAPMLDDADRAVYIAAMEAVWDRAPNDAVVDRLWSRAVEAGFAIYNPIQTQPPTIFFRGEPLGPTFYDNSAYRRMQDGDLACDVLEHLHAPQINARLTAFFEKVDRAINDPTPEDNRIWMYGANAAPMKNVYRLLNAYRPPEVLPLLFHLATGALRQPFNGQVNALHYFWSNRTQPFAVVLQFTDQRPKDYHLARINQPGGIWTFPTQAAEDAAIKKLQAWWATHPHVIAGEAPQEEDGD